MNTRKNVNYLKPKVFITTLRTLVNALPTELEKQEIQADIHLLVDYLTKLQKSFGSLPSIEQMKTVTQAIQKIEQILDEAEANPIIASVAGLRKRPLVKQQQQALTTEEMQKTKATLAELELLPIDEIRSRLESSVYSIPQLRVIASFIGIKSTSRISKDALVHQITMKIANYRGYQRL